MDNDYTVWLHVLIHEMTFWRDDETFVVIKGRDTHDLVEKEEYERDYPNLDNEFFIMSRYHYLVEESTQI